MESLWKLHVQNCPIPAMRPVHGDGGDFNAVIGDTGAARSLPGLASVAPQIAA